MGKSYSDRQMKNEAKDAVQPQRTYFFPKANPPRAIPAKSRKEAEEKLLENKNDK